MDTEGQPCLWRPGQPHVGSSGIGMLTYQPAKQKRTKTSCEGKKVSYNRPSFLGPANSTVCVPHRIYRNAVPEKLLRIVWSDGSLSSGCGCPDGSSGEREFHTFRRHAHHQSACHQRTPPQDGKVQVVRSGRLPTTPWGLPPSDDPHAQEAELRAS